MEELGPYKVDPLKRAPFDRLKSILNEGDPLSKNGLDNLDEILGIEKRVKKVTIFDKIVSVFLKIDRLIFKKTDKMWNNIPHKRK